MCITVANRLKIGRFREQSSSSLCKTHVKNQFCFLVAVVVGGGGFVFVVVVVVVVEVVAVVVVVF